MRRDRSRLTFWALGCSGNGTVTACSFANLFGPTLAVYDFEGNRLWNSEDLNFTAAFSAPLVGMDGSIIAADSRRIIRFDADGNVMWNTATAGGIPIGPVITESGIIVLATQGGPVSANDSAIGQFVDALTIREDPSEPYFFDTGNTPCVIGDRAYVTPERNEDGDNPDEEGRLVAIDVTATWKVPLRWYSATSVGYRQGQYTVLTDGKRNRVVFSRGPNGVFAVGNWFR